MKWHMSTGLFGVLLYVYPLIDLSNDHSSVPFMMSHGLILIDDSNQTLSLMH